MGIFCSTDDAVDTEDIQLEKAIEDSLWSEHVREHNKRQLDYIEVFSKNAGVKVSESEEY